MLKKLLSILGAEKYLSPDLIKKGIEKVEPRMKKFFSESAKYGYPAGAAIGFLKSEFSGESQPVDKSLRPDQAANLEIKRQNDFSSRAAGALGNVAGGAALGGLGGTVLSAASQLLPFGKSQEQSNNSQQEQPQQPGGFMEFINQNPELGQYLDGLMQKGMNPIQAATEAKKHRKFGKLVQSIEGQMGQSFEDLLSQLFQGSQQNGQNTTQNSRQSGQNTTQSGGDSELIAALQQILKM